MSAEIRRWTQEEIDYITDNFGTVSLSAMGRRLGRSPEAVKLKAARLGMRDMLHSGDMITFFELVQAVGSAGSYSWVRQKWERYGFPFHRRKVINNSFLMVDIGEFWKWAEQHKDILNFAAFEENVLGKEPAWAKEKRRHDRAKRRREARPWTKEEDDRLRNMLRAQRYGLDEIAAELNRREGAIRRRIDTLGMKERPVRNPGKWWSAEDVETLQRLHRQGATWEEIGAKVGRTASACRGRYERILNPESMRREARNNKAALREFFQRHQCSHYTTANGCDVRGTDCDACLEFHRKDPTQPHATGWISSKAGTDGQPRVMEGIT